MRSRAVSLLAAALCLGVTLAHAEEALQEVTFSRDVAPILYRHCTGCHRPGQVAPFPLLGYRDAARRARQIARVTASGYMPPWMPEPGYGDFRGERRLSAEEIEVLGRWAAAGAPEGDPAQAPAPPTFTSGWQLGEPDLVVAMPEPYELAADGPDVFRNFVLPLDAPESRWVEAVELRPGNPRIVHHATMLLDPGGRGRELDARDPEVGFEGMLWSGEIAPPEGQLLAWTPGRSPRRLEGLSWLLPESSDMVLEAHLLPSGKPELLQASIGLHFTDRPPARRPVVVRMGSESIDIPAGDADYRAGDRFVLPVDVEALSVYPHAHYLGRRVEATATLPDGSIEWLVRIDDWDFNWQDSYEYREPLRLPAGTRLDLEIAYDNSAANFANPNQPPQRVIHGPRSTDEMGNLWLQVLARSPADRERLESAVREHYAGVVLAGLEAAVRRTPGDAELHAELADHLARRGSTARAAEHYRRAVELEPDSVAARNNLALTLVRLGEVAAAIPHYLEARRLAPESLKVRTNLAAALVLAGRPAEAEALALEALEVAPGDVDALTALGSARVAQGRSAEAVEPLEAALAARSDTAEAHAALGNALAQLGRLEAAAGHYRRALRLRPADPATHNNLATTLAGLGDLEAAAEHYREALRLEPEHPDARRNLALVLERLGQ